MHLYSLTIRMAAVIAVGMLLLAPARSASIRQDAVSMQAPTPGIDICSLKGAVFVEDVESFAQYKVFVEDVESFADLVVFKEQAAVFADRPGLWYLTDVRAFADFTVAFTDVKAFADFSIYFTEFKSLAGCRK